MLNDGLAFSVFNSLIYILAFMPRKRPPPNPSPRGEGRSPNVEVELIFQNSTVPGEGGNALTLLLETYTSR